MGTFTWQTADGNFDNPASWGNSIIVAGINAVSDGSATVQLPAGTNLSGVAANDILLLYLTASPLLARSDGLNGAHYFRVTSVNDGADTVAVTPSPGAATNGLWVIYEANPVAGDDIIFPAGTRSITSGLDQTSVGKFGTIMVKSGFVGTIGTSGKPLICSAALFLFEGDSELNLKASSTLTDLLIISSAHNGVHRVVGTGSTDFSEIRVVAGTVRLQNVDNSTFLHITNMPEINITSKVIIDSNSTLTTVHQNAGEVSCFAPVTSRLVLSGGEWIQEVSGGNTEIFRLIQHGGYLFFNSTGTIAVAIIMGGYLDYTQDTRSKIISDLHVFPGAIADIPNTVTVSSGGSIITKNVGNT